MTKVYIGNGVIDKVEGPGRAELSGFDSTLSVPILHLFNDDFLLFGNTGKIGEIRVINGSLDAKNTATHKDLSLTLYASKAENINADSIWLELGSSISNSSARTLIPAKGNNIIDGIVSAKFVDFVANDSLNISKNGVLKIQDRSVLDFSKISGEGKIYDEKVHAYYDTNNNPLAPDTNINLFTLLKGDNNKFFSFDGTKLVLNEGYEFTLSGDKPAFIVNNGVISKAHITGTELRHISGSGVIKELHLSNAADFGLSSQAQKILIDFGSVIHVYKQVDFKNISGEGFVDINGTFYDTDGHALNNAKNSLQANIKEYNFAVADATQKVKNQKYAYINEQKQEQNSDVELLNQEIVNDNLL